jgi:hypothetical protein
MSATAAITSDRRPLGRTLGEVAVITRRNLLFTVRLPQVLVLSSIMPVIFILMFTYVFGGAIQGALPPAAGSYVNWLLPGLLAQFALFGGSGTASGLAEDLAKGARSGPTNWPPRRSAAKPWSRCWLPCRSASARC